MSEGAGTPRLLVERNASDFDLARDGRILIAEGPEAVSPGQLNVVVNRSKSCAGGNAGVAQLSLRLEGNADLVRAAFECVSSDPNAHMVIPRSWRSSDQATPVATRGSKANRLPDRVSQFVHVQHTDRDAGQRWIVKNERRHAEGSARGIDCRAHFREIDRPDERT